MFRFVFILFSVTLMADIGIMESLKTRAIGEGNEHVTLEIDNDNTAGKVKGVELNLPERFDVKVSEEWLTKNDKKINGDKSLLKEEQRPKIYHFDGENFTYIDKKHTQYENGDYVWGLANGTFKNGILKGEYKWKYIKYCDDNRKLICLKGASTHKLSGRATSEGLLHVVMAIMNNQSQSVDYHYIRHYDEDGHPTNTWDDATLRTNKYNTTNDKIEAHYLLQLPINQSQSSQTFIPDIPEEPTQPIKEQPITIPKTNLSVDISANKEIQEDLQEEEYLDEAMIKYHKKEKERIAREKAEELEDLAQEKAWEEEDKKEEAHQKMLKDWYEEDRQTNIKHIKGLDEQKRRSDEAEQKENQAFHDDIAKMQQEQKAKLENMKQAQEQTRYTLKLIDRFGGDIDTQLMAYEKVIALSNNADLDKATKINKATRKQYFDSSQMRHQGEAEYQTAKVKEWDASIKRAEFIRDTAVTANKILAIPVVAQAAVGAAVIGEVASAEIITTVIPFVHGATTNAIDAGYKDGGRGVAVSLIKDVVDQGTFKLGGGFIERRERIHKYRTTGLQVEPKDKLYDEQGNHLKIVKKGNKIFNKQKQDITFSFQKRLNRYGVKDLWASKAIKDIQSNDSNKVIGTSIDAVSTIKDRIKFIGGFLWKK